MPSLKEKLYYPVIASALALSLQACDTGGSKPRQTQETTGVSTPIKNPAGGKNTSTPESESKVNVVIAYYLSSEAPDLPLDENCGHWLLAGDQSTFKTPLPPGDKTLEFTTDVSVREGLILFGGLPAVADTHVKAKFEYQGGIAVLPLGSISKVEPTRIYFTPYLPANGKPNPDCIKQQPPAY